MDFGQMLTESYEYTKEALWGKWEKWILLIISAIIFPLLMGYTMEVMRGKKPAPPLENWGKLFIDGLKLFILEIIYAIPVILIVLALGIASFLAFFTGDPAVVLSAIGTVVIGIIVIIIVAILIGLVSTIGFVRFSRTDRMGEAFNFGVIFEHIGRIGWGSYFVALLVLVIVVFVVEVVIALVPVIGWLINIILLPAYAIFSYRYITLIYDSVPASN
jgi:hypothetical protein